MYKFGKKQMYKIKGQTDEKENVFIPKKDF